MSGPTARPKQSSRWGSLLSGAVANLESRLDTFFEEEGGNAGKGPRQQTTASGQADGQAHNRAGDYKEPRSSSLSRTSLPNEQRETRLLVPVIQDDSSRASSEPRAQEQGSDTVDAGPRASFESARPESVPAPPPVSEPSTQAGLAGKAKSEEIDNSDSFINPNAPPQWGGSSSTNSSNRPSLDIPASSDSGAQYETSTFAESAGETLPAEEYQTIIAQMRADRETAELQRQEEAHAYLERVDALQAKLQYLAKEAADSARHSAAETTGDTLQKKLAAKDEQIALLMEEGTKLSKSEVSFSAMARKLRAKIAEDGRTMAESKRRLAASEKASNELLERVRRLEAGQRDSSAKSNRISQLERELQVAKASRDEQQSTVDYLRNQLDNEAKTAKAAQLKDVEIALEQERRSHKSLRENAENAKIERQITEDRWRLELKAMREELGREQESKKTAEMQMRNELNILESRLEAMRTRTEEVSSGTGTDSQAKLLRQVETLQSQYALASENWQTLESSLQARVAALEKERDDTGRAEVDARRRARESGTASRRLQEQLEESSRKCSLFEQEIYEKQAQASRLEARVREFEESLREVNNKFEQERHDWNATMAARIEEEKSRWRQDISLMSGPESAFAHIDSPTASMRKSQGLDLSSLATRRGTGVRQFSSELSIPTMNDKHSRRSSRVPRAFDTLSPGAVDSGHSTPFLNGAAPHTPSIYTAEPDDMFENCSSPQRTANDVISVSATGAGPSVQLVERMSAAVRRLESEKSVTKDELVRLVKQRDEARTEVVSLMNEVEEKRAVDTKVAKLERDMTLAEERHQTTLEMLGEKSERVDELEADVADLKKIYRELVQTIKG